MEELIRSLSFIIPGLSKGLIYALLALGLVMVYKCSGVINLAVGEIFILGGYLFYFFAVQLGLSIFIAVILTLIVAFIVGYISQRLLIQPLIGQPLIAMLLAILALGSILVGLIIICWGSQTLYAPRFFPSGGIQVAGTIIQWHFLGFAVVSLLMLIILLTFFRYSKLGLSMMGISEDQQAAQALGISVKRIVMNAWVIGFLVTVIGGMMLTSVTSVQYSQASLGFIGMTVAMVGGLQSLGGVIVGGLTIGLVQGLAAGYIDPYVPGSFQEVSGYIVMMLVLLIRPTGFFGWERIERV